MVLIWQHCRSIWCIVFFWKNLILKYYMNYALEILVQTFKQALLPNSMKIFVEWLLLIFICLLCYIKTVNLLEVMHYCKQMGCERNRQHFPVVHKSKVCVGKSTGVTFIDFLSNFFLKEVKCWKSLIYSFNISFGKKYYESSKIILRHCSSFRY